MSDKPHDPTQRRRQHAHTLGHVARSQDLVSAATLLAGMAAFWSLGGTLATTMFMLAQAYLDEPWLTTDVPTISSHGRELAWALAGGVLPILGCVLVVAVFANVAQVGLLFLPNRLAIDLARVDPLTGAARIFAPAAFVRLGLVMFELVLVSAIAYISLIDQREQFLALPGMEPSQIGAYLAEVLLSTGIKVAFLLVLVALVDYGFQRWRHERDLRMTSPELREEMRDLQGDPQIVARRRQMQRQLPLGSFVAAVPTADVVVFDPSGPAIALRYEPNSMTAPIVVAKGAGALAARIRQIAQDHRVAIAENQQLAHALYRHVEVNRQIPQAQYAAIAAILAHTLRA
jgi:flagellar biosynthetic protein FlhB